MYSNREKSVMGAHSWVLENMDLQPTPSPKQWNFSSAPHKICQIIPRYFPILITLLPKLVNDFSEWKKYQDTCVKPCMVLCVLCGVVFWSGPCRVWFWSALWGCYLVRALRGLVLVRFVGLLFGPSLARFGFGLLCGVVIWSEPCRFWFWSALWGCYLVRALWGLVLVCFVGLFSDPSLVGFKCLGLVGLLFGPSLLGFELCHLPL